MVQKRGVARSICRKGTWRSRFIALALAIGFAGSAQAAGTCNTDTDGPPAYERVKARLTAIFRESPSVSFPAFEAIDSAVNAKCVVTLKGPFQVKRRGKVDFMKFEAELVRANGAPMGWKMLRLDKSK